MLLLLYLLDQSKIVGLSLKFRLKNGKRVFKKNCGLRVRFGKKFNQHCGLSWNNDIFESSLEPFARATYLIGFWGSLGVPTRLLDKRDDKFKINYSFSSELLKIKQLKVYH